MKADVLKNPASELDSVRPSWFISGDVRSFDDVGKRAVYLKMGPTPTLEGLRQAFPMPETRIRFPGSLRKELSVVAGAEFCDDPKPSWPRIERLTITGGFHDGLDVRFGPGLNALIGGKGTGKSTLIEILRYVLHAGEPIDEEAAGNRKHNFRANAEARIAYVSSDGEQYDVLRSGSSDVGKLLRQGTDLGLEVGRRVTLRVFGQRELQSLAQKNEILREFVATEAGDKWVEALADERSQLQTIGELDSELLTLEKQLAAFGDDEQELIDLKDRVARADTNGAADLVKRSAALTSAQTDMSTALAWPEIVAEAVAGLKGVLPAPTVPELPSNREAMVTALIELSTAVTEAATSVETALGQAETVLSAEAQRWEDEHTAVRADIESKLAEAGLEDPRELGQMQAKVRPPPRMGPPPGRRRRRLGR